MKSGQTPQIRCRRSYNTGGNGTLYLHNERLLFEADDDRLSLPLHLILGLQQVGNRLQVLTKQGLLHFDTELSANTDLGYQDQEPQLRLLSKELGSPSRPKSLSKRDHKLSVAQGETLRIFIENVRAVLYEQQEHALTQKNLLFFGQCRFGSWWKGEGVTVHLTETLITLYQLDGAIRVTVPLAGLSKLNCIGSNIMISFDKDKCAVETQMENVQLEVPLNELSFFSQGKLNALLQKGELHFSGFKSLRFFAMIVALEHSKSLCNADESSPSILNEWVAICETDKGLAWRAFVVLTPKSITMLPCHYLQRYMGRRLLQVPLGYIQGNSYNPESISLIVDDLQITLFSAQSQGFHRKICESIGSHRNVLANGAAIESTTYRIIGELSTKLVSPPLTARVPEVKQFLDDLGLETESEILMVDACKWSIDQTLEMGLLFLFDDWLLFLPSLSDRPLISLNLNRLTRLDDSQTPRSTLVLREQNDDYTFLVSDESFAQQFHKKSKLPNRRIEWSGLSRNARRRVLHKQNAHLFFRRASTMRNYRWWVELHLQPEGLLIHHLNQDNVEAEKNGEKTISTLYQGQLVTVLFNNQGGRFSFKTRVADIDPIDDSIYHLHSPKEIELLTEREAVRVMINKETQVLQLYQDEITGDWQAKEQSENGILLDLSEKGCAIIFDNPLELHSRVLVEIPDHLPTLQLHATVLHCDQLLAGGFRLGMFFHELLGSQFRMLRQHLASIEQLKER